MKPTDIKGVIPAIVTPFDEYENLDLDSLKNLTRYLLKNGVHAIMTTGGNGEFPHLLREEKQIVIETIVKEVRGNIPVIAGTTACSTKEAILLSKDAKDSGANAVILTPPFFFKLPEESNYEHFKILTENVDLPIIVYNNPLYTGNNLSPILIDRIAENKNVIGLKQSNSDFGQLVETIRLSGDKISINTGIDSQFYASLCVGAKGIFSTAACIIPEQMIQLYDYAQKGKNDEALNIHIRIQNLNKLLEYDPGYVSPCKEALKMIGLPAGPVRKPLPNISGSELEDIREALTQLHLLNISNDE
jgi:4-hydroxy-tetrahydrodipicolinate synthase